MTGTVDLSGANSYTGTTTVESGTLLVDGSIASSAVEVKSGATIGGSGAAGAVTVDSGATFAPGDPSRFMVASLTLDSGATFVEDIDGAAPGAGGYDQTIVPAGGAVSLGGATLDLTTDNSFTPNNGAVYTIIDNETGSAVSGAFAGLAEGSTVAVDGVELQISYKGGANADNVTLTDLPTIALAAIDAAGGNSGIVNAAEATTATVSGTSNDIGGTIDLAIDNPGNIVATGFVVGAGGAWSAAGLDLSSLTQGGHTLYASIDGLGAFASATTSEAFAVDTVAPTVSSIALTSSQLNIANETSGVGVTVTFSEKVTGFDANDLVLPAGVQVGAGGLGSADGGLTWTGTLTANAGVSAEAGSVSVGVSDPWTDLAGNPGAAGGSATLNVDTAPPTPGTLSFATDSGYTDLDAGHVVTFRLTTGEDVFVTGAPELQLSDGAIATYTGGSGSQAQTFAYTVAAGDTSADLQVAGTNANGGLFLNGGAILDGAGNPLTGGVSADTGLIIDTTAPTLGVESSSSSGGTDIGVGKSVTFTIATSEAVIVTNLGGNGLPTLQLNDGEVATYSGAAGSAVNALTFTYTVQAGRQRRRSPGDGAQRIPEGDNDRGPRGQRSRPDRLRCARHGRHGRHDGASDARGAGAGGRFEQRAAGDGRRRRHQCGDAGSDGDGGGRLDGHALRHQWHNGSGFCDGEREDRRL